MTKLGRLLLVVAIALLPLYYVRFSIFELPTNVVELLIVLGFVAALFSEQQPKPLKTQLVIGTLLLLSGAAIGTLVADDTRTALGILKGWFVVPAMFCWSAWKLFDQKSAHWLFQAIIFSVFLVSLYTILQWAGYLPLIAHQNSGGDLNQYVEQGRALGFFESPNYVSMYLVPLLAIGVAYIWSRTRSIIVVVLLAAPAVTAIYLSGSRAGLVALLTVGLISSLWRRSVKAVLVTAAVLLAAVAVVSLSAPRENTSDQARLFIWREATKVVIDEPLTGIGPGQFQTELDKMLAADSYYQSDVRAYALHPHNLYLSMWLSAGVLGLLGLVLLLLHVLFTSIVESHISRIRVGILAAVAAIAVHGLFDSTYFKNDLSIIFFLTLALWQICESTGRRYDST